MLHLEAVIATKVTNSILQTVLFVLNVMITTTSLLPLHLVFPVLASTTQILQLALTANLELVFVLATLDIGIHQPVTNLVPEIPSLVKSAVVMELAIKQLELVIVLRHQLLMVDFGLVQCVLFVILTTMDQNHSATSAAHLVAHLVKKSALEEADV